MTTNMAERSRTAETGQCQPQSPGRGERGRAPLLQGLLAVEGACLAAECRRRSPSLRGKGGKRLLAEGTEVEKGPGQRPLPRELWRRARHLPLGDEEHLHGGEVVVGSAPSGRERGESPQALQPCLRGSCPVVGRKVRGREPCSPSIQNVGESPGCAEEEAHGVVACTVHIPPCTGGKGGGGEERCKTVVHRSSPHTRNHDLLYLKRKNSM